MSWQTYVDEHLMCDVGDGHTLAAAAILGHDGSVWAQSQTFPQTHKVGMAEFSRMKQESPGNVAFRIRETISDRRESCEKMKNLLGITLKPEEVSGIINDFAEPGYLAPTGLFLGGIKYMVIQGEPGAVIRGKKGSGGVTIKKTGQALIVGIYDEPVTAGQCNMVVERLGDYLVDQGL